MDKPWLLMDIGCYECGEASQPLGLFATEDEAEKFAQGYVDTSKYPWGRPEWHGQHSAEVFDLRELPDDRR